MKSKKYFLYTLDMLKDRLATKLSRREDCKNKLDAYDKEIRELDNAIASRGGYPAKDNPGQPHD